MSERQVKLLRGAFLTGAIADGLALLPMLIPRLAAAVWGPFDASAGYRLAMGYAASLMTGWTFLLVWAYGKPEERRFVALLTLIVLCGLVATEGLSVASGRLQASRMLPTWGLQLILLVWFGFAYHFESWKRWVAAGLRRRP